MCRSIAIIILFLFPVSGRGQQVNWQEYNDQTFEKAARLHLPLVLDLGASWCHWCHVMDDSTYHDKTVIQYLNEHFICIKADQDKRADLFARYKDYGWPATIFYLEDGREYRKEAGYFPPAEFLGLLKWVVAQNKILPPVKKESKAVIRAYGNPERRVADNFMQYLDTIQGGYLTSQRFLEADGIEYALLHASKNHTLKNWVASSIHSSYKINDPVWGGVYQYSTGGSWNEPHFEKILTMQARYIKIYSLYFRQTKDSTALQQAINISNYLHQFLKSPSGLYYNSQDADLVKGVHGGEYFKANDAERRQQGIPAIDSTCYTKENAMLANSFMILYSVTHDTTYANEALTLLHTLEKDYKEQDGFVHETGVKQSKSLSDQLYVGIAYTTVSKLLDSSFASKAKLLAKEIITTYTTPSGALMSYQLSSKYLPPTISLTENIDACRWLGTMHDATGTMAYNKLLKYLCSKEVLDNIIAEPGIAMAIGKEGL